MINFLGIVFISLLVSLPIFLIDRFLQTNFLESFLKNQSLQIMGTLVGLNITTTAFLVGHLTNIEINLKKILFNNSKREIKHNLYFMIVIFLIQLLLLSAIPSVSSDTQGWVINLKSVLIYLGLAIFLLSIYALYEMTKAIFLIDKIINKDK